MGCDFIYENITQGVTGTKQEYVNSSHWLTRNINRGTNTHLLNVMYKVIQLNNWSITDTIIIKCCCNIYTYMNHKIYNNTCCNIVLIEEKTCNIHDCPICVHDFA